MNNNVSVNLEALQLELDSPDYRDLVIYLLGNEELFYLFLEGSLRDDFIKEIRERYPYQYSAQIALLVYRAKKKLLENPDRGEINIPLVLTNSMAGDMIELLKFLAKILLQGYHYSGSYDHKFYDFVIKYWR